MQEAIIIRHAHPGDQRAITRLAALDDRVAPAGDSLLAFVDGDLAVARASNGYSIADPFRRTAELQELVKLRAVQETQGRAA